MPRRLHEAPRRPYYIDTPPYRRTSAGIRVMHLLCHALNRSGEEAYVFTPEVNPALDTPTLTPDIVQRHRRAGREPIIVYPEIVSGNPRRGRSVVRYVLNHPGVIGGDLSYAPTELIYAYGRALLPPGVPEERVMFLPSIDSSLFHNRDNPADGQRQGILIYPGRYPDGLKEHPEIASRATVITNTWPADHAELAALFRRSELLYCFESTALALEAVLCGCPVVALPSPLFKGQAINEHELGYDGIAFSAQADEVARARASVADMQTRYRALEDAFWDKLERFIAATQAMPCHEPPPAPPVNRPEYKLWRERHGLSEAKAQALAERMMLDWTRRPSLHLLVQQGEQPAASLEVLIQSLDSQLYPDWILTVIGTDEVPPALASHPKLQWLALREASASHYVLQEMAKASPAEWIGLLSADTSLEAHALQQIADAINTHPDWQFIYCDDDLLQQGQHHAPRFKPDFNLDLLRSHNYLGEVVWVQKQALTDSGGMASRALATAYELALQIHDRHGAQAIGHLSELLVHHRAPATATPAHWSEERAALGEHLRRQGLSAQVKEGLAPHCHQIHDLSDTQPRVSALIVLRDAGRYLLPLLQSWQQHTDYPDCEIVLADLGSTDPDEQALVQALLAQPGWRMALKHVDARACSPSEALNLAARHASGEFLLCLDVHSHLLQADWLSRLVGIAQRTGVAAVAPRRVDPANSRVLESAWIGGLDGSIGPAARSLGLDEAGPQGRALCEQDVLAADGAALLIKRQALRQQPLLTPGLSLQHAFVELGLRIKAQGQLLVWTPHVVVLQHALESVTDRDAAATLPSTWLPQLLKDGNYNPHLSLRRPFEVDGPNSMRWEFMHGRGVRVLGISLDPGPNTLLHGVLRQLQAPGSVQTACLDLPPQTAEGHTLLLEIGRANPEHLVLHAIHSPDAQALLQSLQQVLPQIRRIGLIDSLASLPTGNFLCAARPDLTRSQLRLSLARLDTVLVRTEADALVLRPAHPDVRVLPELSSPGPQHSGGLPPWLQA